MTSASASSVPQSPFRSWFAHGVVLIGCALGCALGCASTTHDGVTDDSVTATGGTTATGGSVANTLAPTATGGTTATGGSVANTLAPTATGGTTATGGSVANTLAPTATGGASSSQGSTTTTLVWPDRCTVVAGAVAQSLVTNGALLLDVREPSEFATNALTGAVNIPLGSIATRLGELDSTRPIVVYCASGARATQAATQLCAAGYQVYNLGALSNYPS